MYKKCISLLFVLSLVLFSQNAKNIFDSIKNNDLNSVKNIIASGADINAINKDGMTVLIVAAESGNIDIVKELINAGANVNKSSSIGWTPLMGASFEGNTEVVKELINSGADINAFGIKYKNTALMQAIRGENPEIVKILVEAGADINIRNANGETAYDKAMEVGLTEIAGLLKPKLANYSSYTENLSTNTKIIIMIITILIMGIIINILLRFYRYSDEGELLCKVITWGPIILSILNIVTPMDFIEGPFEDIVFILWSIANSIHYKIFEEFDFDNGFNIFIEVIKYIALGIGLFMALTDADLIIKGIFIIALILFIVVLIILGIFSILLEAIIGACACGEVVAIKIIDFIGKTIDEIGNYFKELYGNTVKYIEIKKLSRRARKLVKENNLKTGSGALASSIKEARALDSNKDTLGDSIYTELEEGIYEIIQ